MTKTCANKRKREANASNDSSGVVQTISDVVGGVKGATAITNSNESLSSPNNQMISAFVAALEKFGTILIKLDDTIGDLRDRLDDAETELHDTKVQNDKLLAENKHLKAELDTKTVQLEVDREARERERRRFNIKVTGLDTASKSESEIVDEVLKLHNDNTDSSQHLQRGDIYSVLPIKGRSTGDQKKADSIIVSLSKVELKKRFYALSKKMREKGNHAYIGDDLTIGQRQLFYELKKRTDLFTGAIIRDGAVRCFKKGGGIRQFVYLHELQKLPPTRNDGDAVDGAASNGE